MKNIPKLAAIFFLTVGLGFTAAQASETLVLQQGSSLSLHGDSSLHPFVSTTTQIRASAVVDPANKVLPNGALKHLEIVVPVKTIKSHEGGLDKNMYKALKADVFPDITFSLSKYEMRPSTVSSGAFHVRAEGQLRITDHEKPVILESEATLDGSSLHVTGEYALLMSEYGIKPPTMMMGAIKVRDPIVVRYDLRLRMMEGVVEGK